MTVSDKHHRESKAGWGRGGMWEECASGAYSSGDVCVATEWGEESLENLGHLCLGQRE